RQGRPIQLRDQPELEQEPAHPLPFLAGHLVEVRGRLGQDDIAVRLAYRQGPLAGVAVQDLQLGGLGPSSPHAVLLCLRLDPPTPLPRPAPAHPLLPGRLALPLVADPSSPEVDSLA